MEAAEPQEVVEEALAAPRYKRTRSSKLAETSTTTTKTKSCTAQGEKKMVNSLMYCSEQIVIPDSFPNILKNFAKAAIRTQPYDLLRWSAAYFRCLANNEPPPAKCRLEMNLQCGALTKGYLRVLLDQVGKGFFISRETLQKKWEGLCLPEDELLKYLSLCRMLNWPQIHWLKVFAIMVGSINETPVNSLVMLCELLTEDAEGGSARIPMWMFKTVYTYLAELDCSAEQIFQNGCKMLDDGHYEPETVMDHVPKVISTTSLKECIMTECIQRYKDEYQRESSLSVDGSESSGSCSVGFLFLENLGDPKQFAGKYGDFDSIIVMLEEAQQHDIKPGNHEGPYHVSPAAIEHAKRREAKVDQKREKYAVRQAENAQNCLQQESINMLREIGAPWTWIHHFVSNNAPNISYNFIEEDSIRSDETPSESSDESFDFIRQVAVSPRQSDSDSNVLSASSDNVAELIEKEKGEMEDVPKEEHKTEAVESCKLAEENEKPLSSSSYEDVDFSDATSIVSCLNQDEVGVLQRNGEKASASYTLDAVDQIIRTALKSGHVFKNMEEVVEFAEAKLKEFEPAGKSDDVQDAKPAENVAPAVEDNKSNDDEKGDEPTPDNADMKEKMENLLNECGIEVNLKVGAKKPSGEMILGLPEKKERDDDEENSDAEESEAETPKSTIDTTQNASSRGGYTSDISENEILSQKRDESNENVIEDFCATIDSQGNVREQRRPQYKCTIQPFPGIGKSVSKKTIQDFLTYLKFRSRSQKGMVCPRNFREDKCPKMFD